MTVNFVRGVIWIIFCYLSEVNSMEINTEYAMKCQFNEFVNLEDNERREVITTCSPEQQVELYLKWSRHTLPSNTDYAEDIAKTGKLLLPALLARLEKHDHLRDDIDKPELLVVIDDMQRLGYYAVADCYESMLRIENAVYNMEVSPSRESAFKILSLIKNKK